MRVGLALEDCFPDVEVEALPCCKSCDERELTLTNREWYDFTGTELLEKHPLFTCKYIEKCKHVMEYMTNG